MIRAILSVLAIAALGSLSVPVIMLALAKLGYFEPLSFRFRNRTWYFSPKVRVVETSGNGTQGYVQNSWIMVSTVSTVLTVIPPLTPPSAIERATANQAASTVGYRDLRLSA